MRRFVLLILLGLIATAILSLLYARSYQFVLASEEARTALVVTDELNRELKAATYASDLIAFTLLGSVLATVTALVCSSRSHSRQKVVGAIVGVVAGGLAGALGAVVGHWYVGSMQLQLDPMVQWALRWTLILLPIALAAAISTAAAGNFRRDIGNALAGGLIGPVVAGVVFAVLHGVVTTTENFSVVMPGFTGNRVLVVASAIFGIGLGLIWQIKDGPVASETPSEPLTEAAPVP